MLIELAKSTGVCDDCYNNTTGEWVRGLRVTAHGVVSSPAVPGVQPAILAVTKMEHSSVGCPEGKTIPEMCVGERPNLLDVQAPCWEEDKGCRNLDDPFTKPTMEAPPDLESAPEADTGDDSSASSWSVVISFASLAIIGLFQ